MAHIFKDKILLLLIFVVPLLYAIFFGAVYSQGVLTDIPLAVVDLDQSALSREVVKSFVNSPVSTLLMALPHIPSWQKAWGKI